MPSERDRLPTRLLLVAAFLVTIGSIVWATRTPVGPNSDRYDYLGRAHHVLEGIGPRPMVAYPLRFAFEGADTLPPENLTRPPAWPVAIAPALRLGAGDASGVATAAIALLTLLPLVALAGDRAFGPGAGGFAALAVATSFATVRALWGGGPELWIAFLMTFVWTWNPPDRPLLAGGVLGLALALMPWLHPIGGLYAVLALASRIGRSAPTSLMVAAALGLALGLPWYVQAGHVTGGFLAPLQGFAELAKALHDAGGLGPYRGLDPVPTLDVIRADPSAWLYHTAWNLKEQALGMDGWLAWTLVPLALFGVRRDPWLALRDAFLGLVAFAVVSAVANDPRLLVPMLPVAAIWAGAGYAHWVRTRVAGLGPPIAIVLALAPWVFPLGRTPLPGGEVDATTAQPTTNLVRAVGAADDPVMVDAAVLAWRARRPALFVPRDPASLAALRQHPALAGTGAIVLQTGRSSPWIDASWATWLDGHEATAVDGGLVVTLDTRIDSLYVPAPLTLGAEDVPDSLVTLSVPPGSRDGIQVTAATARALDALLDAARADGVELRIISGYRSYQRQSALYERARVRHGDDQRWVAAPGTSEHQLGTTVDFADAALRHAVEPTFEDTPEGRWLAVHAREFGFVRSYTEANQEQTGYRPEPWHFRHRPILFPELQRETRPR